MKRLVSTIGLSHEEWLKYRKQGIGGSDAGAVCGLNPYANAMSVFYDKTGDEADESDNEAMRQGRDLEDYVAHRFMEATELKVRRVNSIFYHEQNPFMLANIDRMVVGENIGLECKTANILNADKWENGDVPPHYQIQCHHYMAVTGADAWYIAVVILGKEFKFVKLERDEEIIHHLITIEKDFWENHILKRVIPEPDGSKVADSVIQQYYGSAKISTPINLYGFDERLQRRQEIGGLLNKLEKEKKQIEQEVKLTMGESEKAKSDMFAVTWKNVSTSKLDMERLKSEQPNVYKKYLKENISRRLIIKAA